MVKDKLDNLFGPFRRINALISIGLLTFACSQKDSAFRECANITSLMRFDVDAIDPSMIKNIDSFLSNGGFIEALARKDLLGPIDRRLSEIKLFAHRTLP